MESVATWGWQRGGLGAVCARSSEGRAGLTQQGPATPNARPRRAVSPSPTAPPAAQHQGPRKGGRKEKFPGLGHPHGEGTPPRARPPRPALRGLGALTSWYRAGSGATSAPHRRGGRCRCGHELGTETDSHTKDNRPARKDLAAVAAAPPAAPPLGDSNDPERR